MDNLNMDKINLAMSNLRRNNMAAYFVETKAEVLPLVQSLMNEGESVTHGGSETIKECGLTELLESGAYNYIDRSKAATPEEVEKVYREAYFADTYIGNSNRVSAYLYGPRQVILICGYNKLVKDLDEATYRVKKYASPQNTKRLNCDTYCRMNGECLSVGSDASYMCDGCRSEGRICCNYVISARQRRKDRIKVIFVGEKLGY